MKKKTPDAIQDITKDTSPAEAEAPEAAKPAPAGGSSLDYKYVKTSYIDTSGIASISSKIVGAVFVSLLLTFGAFALTMGLTQALALDVNAWALFGAIFCIQTVVTVLYYVPTTMFFLGGTIVVVAGLGLYTWLNFDFVSNAVIYSFNRVVYLLVTGGQIGAGAVYFDGNLAANSGGVYDAYLLFTFIVVGAVLATVLSLIVYSRRSFIYVLIVSALLMFPPFYYGMLPSYTVFGMVLAFWIALFCLYTFRAGAIMRFAEKRNRKPKEQAQKRRYRAISKAYYSEISTLRAKITDLARNYYPDDRSAELRAAVTRLLELQPDQRAFFKSNGVEITDGAVTATAQYAPEAAGPAAKKTPGKPTASANFRTPMQAERDRIEAAIAVEEKAEREAELAERKKVRNMSLSGRLSYKIRRDMAGKTQYTASGGFIVVTIFVLVFMVFTLTQALLSPNARPGQNLPQRAISAINNTIDYMLNSPRAGFYTSYSGGGMGGGSLFSQGGVHFSGKAVLRVRDDYRGTVYLRGWVGTTYTGRMWIESTRKQTTDFTNTFGRDFNPDVFYYDFFNYMTAYPAQLNTTPMYSSMVTNYKVSVTQLLKGGRLAFLPYFGPQIDQKSALNVGIQQVADTGMRLSNTLFVFPQYTSSATLFNDFMMGGTDALAGSVPASTADQATYDGTADSTQISINDTVAKFMSLAKDASAVTDSGLRGYIYKENQYYQYAMRTFLQLPADLPPQIAELTQSITKDCASDYDRACAIADYLSTTFPYTLTPTAPQDKNADFVYNFLFDVKEGYCTYYASAMTVMLRTLDIPARYVEGYAYDNSDSGHLDSDGYFTVRDTNSHAWTEVYIRGIGWVPFDSTAPAPIVEQPTTPTTSYVYHPVTTPANQGGVTTPTTTEDLGDTTTSNTNTPIDAFVITLLVLVVLFVAIILANGIAGRRRMDGFTKQPPREGVLRMMDYMFRVLGFMRLPVANGESLTAYFKRVKEKSPFISGTQHQAVMNIMEQARYSEHDITEEERAQAVEFIKTFTDNVLRQLSLPRKLFAKYVKFMM